MHFGWPLVWRQTLTTDTPTIHTDHHISNLPFPQTTHTHTPTRTHTVFFPPLHPYTHTHTHSFATCVYFVHPPICRPMPTRPYRIKLIEAYVFLSPPAFHYVVVIFHVCLLFMLTAAHPARPARSLPRCPARSRRPLSCRGRCGRRCRHHQCAAHAGRHR